MQNDFWTGIKLVEQAADYMIDYGWSVREIADNMMVGKSTVYNWLTKHLKHIDTDKYYQCQYIMKQHKEIKRDDRTGKFKKSN